MSVAGLPLSQQIRLAFIDDCLQRSRRANRRDITSAFGVSVPTASLDFAVFVKTFPERVRYDAKAKRYRAVSGSVPVYFHATRVERLETSSTRSPSRRRLIQPKRRTKDGATRESYTQAAAFVL